MSEESVVLVRSLLRELHIETAQTIRPGEIVLKPDTDHGKLALLRKELAAAGLHFIFSRKEILSEKIKHLLRELVFDNAWPAQKYSVYISERLHLNYTYLANNFSATQGITIEHYIIEQRIAFACRLLMETELSVGEIAEKLHYSSIGHFSAQFKKVKGCSPSSYKKNWQNSQEYGS